MALKEISTERTLIKCHATDLCELLLETITDCQDESIRVVAIDGLSDILEDRGLEDGPAFMPRMDFLRNKLLVPGNRRSWNSKLRLRCTFLRLDPPNCVTEAACPRNCELCACLKACSLALDEETVGHTVYSLPVCKANKAPIQDYPTRDNALRCLRILVQVIFHTKRTSSNPQHVQMSSLILLKALNDDDEELRDVASSIEAAIAITVGGLNGTRPLTPFAAINRLIEDLIGETGTDLIFQFAAIKAIVRIQDNANTMLVDEVSSWLESKIQQALRTSDELFEEEKQNLYSDDVRNIKLWTAALRRLKPEAVHLSVISVIVAWASHGLDRAVTLLEERGQDGPLGLSWQPDVVTLFTSILGCSELVLVWAPDSDRLDVREKLHKLQKTASRTGALGPMSQHITSILTDIL